MVLKLTMNICMKYPIPEGFTTYVHLCIFYTIAWRDSLASKLGYLFAFFKSHEKVYVLGQRWKRKRNDMSTIPNTIASKILLSSTFVCIIKNKFLLIPQNNRSYSILILQLRMFFYQMIGKRRKSIIEIWSI